MKTLTDLALNKMANNYLNSLSHVLYKLDGVENQTTFFKTEIKDNTVAAYVFFDESYKGKISDIRVIDKDGDTVSQGALSSSSVTSKSSTVGYPGITSNEL